MTRSPLFFCARPGWLALAALGFSAAVASAQSTAFTYQARLTTGSANATGWYDLRFKVYQDSLAGTQVGTTFITNGVLVTGGLLCTTVDFGAGVFNGQPRWLEIGIKTNNSASYTVLSPLQIINSTPQANYAATAANVSGAVAASQISGGTLANAVLPASPTFGGSVSAGAFSGSGAGLTNVNAATLNGLNSSALWQLGGNTPTTTGVLGTVNNQALEFRVNNLALERLAWASNAPNGFGPNVVLGNSANWVSNDVVGATICGGGSTNNQLRVGNYTSYASAGGTNVVLADYGTAVGGIGNQVTGAGAVAMGVFSKASGFAATALGQSEAAGGNSTAFGSSTARGGQSTAMGESTSSGYCSVAGGVSLASGNFATALGISEASGTYATALGSVTASGDYSLASGNDSKATNDNAVALGNTSIAGGSSSFAAGIDCAALAAYSQAMGYFAISTNKGTFVWADAIPSGTYSEPRFFSQRSNEFALRATSGVRIQTDVGIHLSAADRPMLVRDWDLFAPSAPDGKAGIGRWGLFMEPSRLTLGIPGNDLPGRCFQVAKYTTNGAATTLVLVDQAGNLTAAGTVNGSSDRNAKENFSAVDAREVLERVAAMPVSEWNYREDPNTRHIGPMAQDFYAAFNVGPDEKHITMVDADGVALAAIQGLNQKLEEKETRIRTQADQLQVQAEALRAQRTKALEQEARANEQAGTIAELKARLERLEQRLQTGSPTLNR